MSYDANKPANNDFLADFPPQMREQLRAIINDQIVDALKLCGLSPGNASGNIPISNGTTCIGLNADKLDGNEASAFAMSGHPHNAATGSSNGFMTNTDKTKLDGISSGAEVNQMAFSNVLVGSTTIQADSKTDTLEIVAGTNIAITPDAVNDRVTIAVTGTVAAATTAGSCTGNAATATTATTAGTATKLATGRTIAISGKVTGTVTTFDGSANISIPVTAVVADSCTGNSATATTATTATTAGACTGNAATATKLATARKIAGVNFDGTADIDIPYNVLSGVPYNFNGFNNIKNIVNSNTAMTLTADYCPFNQSSLNLTVNTGTIGANGLDTGTIAANTWYSLWVIYNGTTVAGLLSTSQSTPTLPSGYTNKVRVGWVRTGASGYLLRTLQLGKQVQYQLTASTNTIIYPVIASGVQGTCSGNTFTPVASSVSGVVPPTASKISTMMCNQGGGAMGYAPNANFGGPNSSNPAICLYSSQQPVLYSSCILESTNLYYAGSASGSILACQGWEDNL